MGDGDKCNANVKVKDIRSSPLLQKCSYVITQKATVWGWHDSLMLNPCWLFPTICFTLLPPEVCSKRTCSMIFLCTKLSLTSSSHPSFLSSLKIGTTFVFLQSSGTFSDHQNLSKVIESNLTRAISSSFSTLRCSLLDLYTFA